MNKESFETYIAAIDGVAALFTSKACTSSLILRKSTPIIGVVTCVPLSDVRHFACHILPECNRLKHDRTGRS